MYQPDYIKQLLNKIYESREHLFQNIIDFSKFTLLHSHSIISANNPYYFNIQQYKPQPPTLTITTYKPQLSSFSIIGPWLASSLTSCLFSRWFLRKLY